MHDTARLNKFFVRVGIFAEEAHVVLMNHAPDTLLLGECSKPSLHVALDEEVGRNFLLLVHHGLRADWDNVRTEDGPRRGGRGDQRGLVLKCRDFRRKGGGLTTGFCLYDPGTCDCEEKGSPLVRIVPWRPGIHGSKIFAQDTTRSGARSEGGQSQASTAACLTSREAIREKGENAKASAPNPGRSQPPSKQSSSSASLCRVTRFPILLFNGTPTHTLCTAQR